MTLKEKKIIAKDLVDELEGKSYEELEPLIDDILRDYSPINIGTDCELWREIITELINNKTAHDLMQSMEHKAVRMREYKVRIRIDQGNGQREEEVSVLALSKIHAYERAAEEFEKTIAAERKLNPKDWYLKLDELLCNS
jgi:hypothetical protein